MQRFLFCRRPQLGFTLIEAMVVVALVGILARLSYSYSAPIIRKQQFRTFSRAVVTACNTARSNALQTGNRTCMSIENNAVVAFVDVNGDKTFSGADVALYRYPTVASQTLPAGLSVTSTSLKEKGTGPQTAVFDNRGFYIDSFDGYPRHDANLCLTDTVLGRTVNVFISRLGPASVTSDACQP